MQMKFEEALQVGLIGESLIASWLMSKGWNVLPVYEVENDNKGPRLFSQQGKLIAPDAFAFKANKALFVEVKHKTAFSWYRKRQIWNTGIDLNHYNHYIEVAKLSNIEVWLLFLHKGGQAKDSPPSPSGLYGGELSYLQKCEDHRCSPDEYGNSGMVYWNKDDLKHLATIEEVIESARRREQHGRW